MAAISFPAAHILHGEITERAVANLHRTQMESGVQKQAPKQSRSTVNCTVPFILTASQYASFKSSWWPTTSKYGALWFNIDLGEGSVEARCLTGEFEAQPLGPSKTHFRVTLQLEVVL